MSFKATEIQSAFEPLDAKECEVNRRISRKAGIVLDWLLLGGTLLFRERTVRMFDGRIYVEALAEQYEGECLVSSEPKLLGIDFALEDFLSECEKTSDEDIGVIAMNLGLSGERKGR